MITDRLVCRPLEVHSDRHGKSESDRRMRSVLSGIQTESGGAIKLRAVTVAILGEAEQTLADLQITVRLIAARS